MQALYNNIFNNGQPTIIDATALQAVTAEYPYFALAHFYALQQTPNEAKRYQQIAAKTTLFFSNPYFLQQQLSQLNNQQINATTGPTIIFTSEVDITNKGKNENATAVNEHVAMQEIETAKNITFATEDDDSINDEVIGDALLSKIKTIEADDNTADELIGTTTATEQPIIDIDNIYPTNSSYSNTAELQNNNTSLISTEKFNELKKHLEATDADTPLFEPLHATDYFASQGIKINEEDIGSDKLSIQLKSFTAWLKTMKKVHPDKLPQTNIIVETAIQKQAEKSNIEEEILTEAMADAFIQQNKLNKAREVYQKLSLLNPTKSAYFAAKLQNLK